MAYIEAHQSLRDHRKILALAAELDMPEPHVAGHCLYLWLWSLDNAPDGVLPRSERIVERAAGWIGASGAFVAAMVTVGMLERDEDGALSIHDWYDYAGRLIEKRRENAERMRRARADTHPDTSTGRATHVQRTFTARAGATVPYLNVENHRDTPSKIDNSNGVHAAANDSAATSPPLRALTSLPTPANAPDVAPKPRANHSTPNPLWDALVEAMGYAPTTPREKSNWGGVVRQLEAAQATPQDVRRRSAHYRAKYGFDRDGNPIALTINALVNHWSELSVEPPKPSNGHSPGHASRASPPEPPPPRPASDFDLWKEPEMDPALMGLPSAKKETGTP